MSETAKKVVNELDKHSWNEKYYRSPKKLRKRHDIKSLNDKIKSNNTVKTVQVHKETLLSQYWEAFKRNNFIFYIFGSKLEDKDSILSRTSNLISEKFVTLFHSELSKTFTEISKADPNFNECEFLETCRYPKIFLN